MDSTSRELLEEHVAILISRITEGLKINKDVIIQTFTGKRHAGKVLDIHDGYVDLHAEDDALVVMPIRSIIGLNEREN